MNYKEINEHFLMWCTEIKTKESFYTAEKTTLLIKDIEETEMILVGEIFQAITTYTDKFHIFVFSERTTWIKDKDGDTTKPYKIEYSVISKK